MDAEGRGNGVIKVLSWHLHEGAEENKKKT
jgi:hypothetical protein